MKALAAGAILAAIGVGCMSSADLGGSSSGASGGAGGGPPTKLPPLLELTNLLPTARGDSVGIDFDPVDGARDYRIYPLPKDEDVTIEADGTVVIANAIYRCAGDRQADDNRNSLNQSDPQFAEWEGITLVDPDPAKNTLGHVHARPAPSTAPVYVVAIFPMDGERGWRESRDKIYTTDSSERQSYLDQGGRDDGIVFYVPQAPSASTETVYTSERSELVPGPFTVHRERFYFTAASMAEHETDTTPPAPVFQVLKTASEGTKPLMKSEVRVAGAHTELSVGAERFHRAVHQGNSPLWHVEWSGLTEETTLVIEALDVGCPFRGFLSAEPLDAPPHQTFYTLEALQKASSTGEVFINGQHEATNVPKAIARSFVTAGPAPHDPAEWDFFADFAVGTEFGDATPATCTEYRCERWQTDAFDFGAAPLDQPNGAAVFTWGQFLGQLWVAFADDGGGTAGTSRLSARKKATIDADPQTFLRVTMSVDIVSTHRRYPQLIVSDQDPPIQESFGNPDQNAVIVMPFLGPSMRIEAQAFHGLVQGASWSPDNLAEGHALVDYDGWMDPEVVCTSDAPCPEHNTTEPPSEPPFEHAGMDRMTTFDVYLSSERLYLFLDGSPAGCTLLPPDVILEGEVSVTLGDVLFHEGAPDELVCAQEKPYGFLHGHQCSETKRHFDDFGFKSGASAPSWDEQRFPCRPY